MKAGLGLLLLVVTILAGCVGTAHLYPVQGPLSTQTAPPVLTPKATISRSYTVNLDGGETCTGTAALVPLVDTSPSKLSDEWDAVYGAGFYVAHVLGTRSYTLDCAPHLPQRRRSGAGLS
jgi:hypothetical protein